MNETKPVSTSVKFDILYEERKIAGQPGWNDSATDIEVLNWITLLFNISNVSKGKLLELGCGAGNLSIFLNKRFELTCLDVSSVAIDWAKKNLKGIKKQPHFSVGNVCNLSEFHSESFDYVLDSLCLHFIMPEFRAMALNEINRVLKKTGLFFVISMCEEPQNQFLRSNFNYISRCVEFNHTPECYFGKHIDI